MPDIEEVKRELKRYAEPVYRAGARRFFKERVNLLGVRTPMVRRIAARFFASRRALPKRYFLDACDKLMREPHLECKTVALAWAYKFKSRYEPSDFFIFERWLKKYVDNWATCDDLCTHALGALLHRYPELQKKTAPWIRSKNRWVRRAAAVVLIYPYTRPNNFLKEIFSVADALLEDTDDMVQKGYGWMLKVAADFHRREVFDFVMSRRARMPRTALRYAVEKMPPPLKRRAMH